MIETEMKFVWDLTFLSLTEGKIGKHYKAIRPTCGTCPPPGRKICLTLG